MLIVNATNIGRNLSGIGRYSLGISEFLLKHWEHPLELILNARGSVHFEEPQFKAVLCLCDHYIPLHLIDSVIKGISRKVTAGAKHA